MPSVRRVKGLTRKKVVGFFDKDMRHWYVVVERREVEEREAQCKDEYEQQDKADS